MIPASARCPFLRLLRIALALSTAALLGGALPPIARATAIVDATGTSYQTSEPTVANWNTGWGAAGITGWDYVGQVNGASGVYLGNGFVLTAGHVGAGDLLLNGTTYTLVLGSAQSIGSADLTLFQIATRPTLPSLTISGSGPLNTSVVILGYGGGQGKTWASSTVNGGNMPVQVDGYSYTSTDFYSDYNSSTNPAQLITGDSGGPDFRYRNNTQSWELAGINEAYANENGAYARSYFVQLSTYKSAIQAAELTAAPEPGSVALIALPAALALLRRRR